MRFPIDRIDLDIPICYKPPAQIFVQGSAEGRELLNDLPHLGLAIVGTRRPQPRAEALVHRTVRELRGTKLIIVSGLALGIDACAHEAALESRLPTVAVLGCGLNHQYPRENQQLRERILEQGGLILSEYEPDIPAEPHFFLMRNRLIAALSRATWIAQAPLRSGALNTAKWVRATDSHAYATPCFPGDPPFAGTQDLIDRYHAEPVWNAESFGRTWLELATICSRRRSKKVSTVTQEPIFVEIYRRTAQTGGVTTSELFDWALKQEINPLEFFERLQKVQECGSVSDRGGVLAAT